MHLTKPNKCQWILFWLGVTLIGAAIWSKRRELMSANRDILIMLDENEKGVFDYCSHFVCVS